MRSKTNQNGRHQYTSRYCMRNFRSHGSSNLSFDALCTTRIRNPSHSPFLNRIYETLTTTHYAGHPVRKSFLTMVLVSRRRLLNHKSTSRRS